MFILAGTCAFLDTSVGLCEETGKETTYVSIILQWFPQSQFAGFIAAYEMGYFDDNGLKAELVFYDNTGSMLDKLVKNEIHFVTAWLSQAITIKSRGNDIVNIFQLLKKSSLMLVTKASYGIRKPEDISNRCLSVWGGDFSIQPNAFFNKYGIKPDLVYQSYSIEPFLAGACEVTSAMYYNEYNKIYQAGFDHDELVTFMFSDYGLNFPEDGIYCSREFLINNRDIALRFLDAVVKGWEYAFENPDTTINYIMEYSRAYNLKTNRAHQEWMLNHIKEAFLYNTGNDTLRWGYLSREEYENVAEILLQQGIIDNVPDFQEFYIDLRNEK